MRVSEKAPSFTVCDKQCPSSYEGSKSTNLIVKLSEVLCDILSHVTRAANLKHVFDKVATIRKHSHKFIYYTPFTTKNAPFTTLHVAAEAASGAVDKNQSHEVLTTMPFHIKPLHD